MSDDQKAWLEKLRSVTSWRSIVFWPVEDLRRLGIATMNLFCADGLPGTAKVDIGYCLAKIDAWAEKVKFYTAQMTHVFERHPERFDHSRGYFKALCLITCLQQQCGVRYNPAKRDRSVPLVPADSFIFGIIQGDGGNCASLPVLYCAVGYRLGYPMFLVGAKEHFFVRWDDGEVRFNIEATGEGMGTPPDNHYRTGRFEVAPVVEERSCYLKPKTIRQCLASFLGERARFCMDLCAFQEAVLAMSYAAVLHPENHVYLNSAKMM